MKTIKKKELNELVGGDIYSNGNDQPYVGNKEIETGPVQKHYSDDSTYEKGQSTTTDRVFGRYRQNIPWFAVYTYGGRRSTMGLVTFESEEKVVLNKKNVEEAIEDLVKKTMSSEITDKNYDPKYKKILEFLESTDLSDEQVSELMKKIVSKK